MNLRLLGSLFAITTLLASSASAQYINSGPSSSRAVRYVAQGPFNEQPLTVNPQDISVFVGPLANPKFGTNEEAGIHAIHLPFGAFDDTEGGETVWFFQAGAAYGIARGFEAGLFTPPLLMSPKTGSGDLPVFVTWASSVEDLDIGIRSTVTIPVRSDAFWRWNPGLHALVRFERGRLDLGAFFPLVFADDDQVLASLEVPIRMSFAVADGFFLGVETGLRKLDIAHGDHDLFLPVGASALYSIEAGEHRIDVGVRFNWQSLVWINAPEEWPDRVLQDTYSISFGANGHFDIGGGTKVKKKEEKKPEPTQSAPAELQGKPKCVYNEDCVGGGICQNAQCIPPGGQP